MWTPEGSIKSSTRTIGPGTDITLCLEGSPTLGLPGCLETMRSLAPWLDLSAEVSHGVSQSLEVIKSLGCSGSAEAIEGEVLSLPTGGDAGVDPLSGCMEAANSVAGHLIAGQVSGESPVIELLRSHK